MNYKKTVLFVFLVIVLYFISVKMVVRATMYQICPHHKITALAAVVFTAIVFLLAHFLMKCEIKDGYRLLEISPAKKCIGGPYMWGDVNSPTYKYCSDPKNQQAIKDASCCVGFVGMPVKYTYTPESDSQWKNPRCHIYGSGHVDGVGN